MQTVRRGSKAHSASGGVVEDSAKPGLGRRIAFAQGHGDLLDAWKLRRDFTGELFQGRITRQTQHRLRVLAPADEQVYEWQLLAHRASRELTRRQGRSEER